MRSSPMPWALLLSLFLVFFTFLPATPSIAGGSFRLGASPALLELDTVTNSTELREVLLYNRGDIPTGIRVEIWDWKVNEKGENEFLPPQPESKSSMAKWIQVVPDQTYLDPGETGVFKVLIRTPPEARGGHQAVIFFQSTPPVVRPLEEEKSLHPSVRVGVLVLQRTKGTYRTQILVERLRVSPPTSRRELEVSWVLKNPGDAYVLPHQELLIVDESLNPLLRLRPEEGRVFPGVPRTFTVRSAAPLPKGSYQAILAVEYEGAVTQAVAPFSVP